jgi:NTP pyrophosphatase (non-canonical NTP hydrolase)
MDLQKYTQFVIERSTLRPDDIDFSMLRAACGLVAELDELMSEYKRSGATTETLQNEIGDVAFWCVALKYWIEKAGLTVVQNSRPLYTIQDNGAYICDRVEKYTRKGDLSKLQEVYDAVCYTLEDLPQSIIDINVAKLTANPRGITHAA